MKIKLYEAIVDDGTNVYKATGTAKNKKEFKEIYKGNGEIIKLEEKETALTNEAFMRRMEETLTNAQYGKNEIKLILAILENNIQ